ncbi:MAG TPA: lipopolysaccharide transport periplasmic protein LptA [Azospira sp.]|nr:lipopolysaccharide transport periplasmic protein LptA [Azospira sp.]
MTLRPLPLPVAMLMTTLVLLAALPARAEKADREKPVNLESDKVTVDDAKKVHVFEGNVTLTQGTLVIRGDRIVVTQDNDGFQKGVVYGKPARFKQKREGRDDYVEGEGLRIEHDAKTEKTEFFDRAYVKSGQDEVRGHYIQYDSLTEQYLVTSAGQKTAAPGEPPSGRVRAVIQPKKQGPETPQAGASAPSLTLKPAITLPSRKE